MMHGFVLYRHHHETGHQNGYQEYDENQIVGYLTLLITGRGPPCFFKLMIKLCPAGKRGLFWPLVVNVGIIYVIIMAVPEKNTTNPHPSWSFNVGKRVTFGI